MIRNRCLQGDRIQTAAVIMKPLQFRTVVIYAAFIIDSAALSVYSVCLTYWLLALCKLFCCVLHSVTGSNFETEPHHLLCGVHIDKLTKVVSDFLLHSFNCFQNKCDRNNC